MNETKETMRRRAENCEHNFAIEHDLREQAEAKVAELEKILKYIIQYDGLTLPADATDYNFNDEQQKAYELGATAAFRHLAEIVKARYNEIYLRNPSKST